MEVAADGKAGLATAGIGKSFGKRSVLDDLSLRVRRGEIVGLLGPNGSGKTICFYCLIGLIKPDRGRILLDGDDITGLTVDERARKGLGYLPQEPSIFGGMTGGENIMAVLEHVEPDATARNATLEKLFDEFEIGGVRNQEARLLATGERRLCEFARAMAAKPDILLLDEPFSGQDPRTVDRLKGVMLNLKSRNVGLLATDHNVHDLLEIVDRAYLILDGRLFFEGSPDELNANSDARRLYLGENFQL